MNKLLLTILFFTSIAHAGEESTPQSTPEPLCTLSLYRTNPELAVGTKFQMKNGTYFVSDCANNPKISMDWWELSKSYAQDWDESWGTKLLPQ